MNEGGVDMKQKPSSISYHPLNSIILIMMLVISACGLAGPLASQGTQQGVNLTQDNPLSVTDHPEEQAPSAVQKQWNGYWYGSFVITKSYGKEWGKNNELISDFYAFINIDSEGNGYLDGNYRPFDVAQEYASELSMWITADEKGFKQVNGDAWFWDMPIVAGENGESYQIAHAPNNTDAFVISSRYVDPTDENKISGFEFNITLFRWGKSWDKSIGKITPPSYEKMLFAMKQGLNPTEALSYEIPHAIEETLRPGAEQIITPEPASSIVPGELIFDNPQVSTHELLLAGSNVGYTIVFTINIVADKLPDWVSVNYRFVVNSTGDSTEWSAVKMILKDASTGKYSATIQPIKERGAAAKYCNGVIQYQYWAGYQEPYQRFSSNWFENIKLICY